MRFAYPLFLLLLLLIPLLVWFHFKKRKKATIKYSDLNAIRKIGIPVSSKKRDIVFILRIAVLSLLILGFARPQSGRVTEETLSSMGVDIILCMDTSGSMRAEDFKPNNRLYVAKQVAKDFVLGRKNDRIGVVVFSAISFTQCPPTLDYSAVVNMLDNVEIGMTQTDGTAIGTAIATCTNRLKDLPGKSKIIILLTDGRNNMGEIDPVTAAKAAAAFGIKIYTIGAGQPGGAMFPVDNPIFGRRYVQLQEDLDEDTLMKIAEVTEGKYFRATSAEKLAEIYKQIDKMEKVEVKIKEYKNYDDLYELFLYPVLLLLFTEIVLSNTYFRKIP